MNCTNQFIHIVRFGDTIYNIARMYNVNEEDIFYLNPHINPYNLRIGESIIICPRYSDGMNFYDNISIQEIPQNISVQSMPIQGVVRNEMSQGSPYEMKINISKQRNENLMKKMRMVWEQHVMWTRLLIISLIDSLLDTASVEKRLMQNPKDMANVFKTYYGAETAKKIEDLITEHLSIGEKLIKATKKNETKLMADLNKQWYQNADKIADYFASINPHYDREALKEMLYKHLDLTKEEVGARLQRNYEKDVKTYDNIEQEALMMADFFVEGLGKQFSSAL